MLKHFFLIPYLISLLSTWFEKGSSNLESTLKYVTRKKKINPVSALSKAKAYTVFRIWLE